MTVQVSYPGVYIDEFTPGAPIEGVGTSMVAFLGMSRYGPPNEPALITSWDAFLATFTSGKPTDEDPPADDDYLWYAVRGFFQNGGQTCYVTAISSASPDEADLNDESGAPTITVTARRSGLSNPQITVSAAQSHAVMPYDAATAPKGALLFAPKATGVTASQGKLTFASDGNAANFVSGDRLKIVGGGHTEFPVVGYRSGREVFLTADLTNTYTGATVTLAPSDPTSFRVSGDAGALVSGSIVTLTQTGNLTSPKTTIVTSVTRQRLSPVLTTFGVSVKDDVSAFDPYGANAVTLRSEEFTLTVSGLAQPYTGLSMNPGHPRYYETVVNGDPDRPITVSPHRQTPNTTSLPRNRPTTLNAGLDQPVPLTGGASFDPTKVTSSDYGDVLDTLQGNKEINIVVVADRTDQDVQGRVLAHCELMKGRFAIFASQKGAAVQDIFTQLQWLVSDKGFGALYYPWISVASAKSSLPILVPPSGHVAGIYARTDTTRGVFKAPAGTEATVATALGVEAILKDADQGLLNRKGINVIRVFQKGSRPVVWGARTTATPVNTSWQYVNVRRLFIFLEESIKQGIRRSVFEPNNRELWQKLKRTISAFLTQQWRDGALFGETAKDAFYVRIDETLNPPDQRALGRLTVEIGVKPAYPAEFIVVRIGIWEGGSEVTE
jgi:phage tail sheath protein FI